MTHLSGGCYYYTIEKYEVEPQFWGKVVGILLKSYVENISSIKTEEKTKSRFSRAEENRRRTTYSCAKTRERTEASFRMTSRSYRLNGMERFRSLFRYGKKLDTPLFRVFFLKNDLSNMRLAVVAPRAVDKRSVRRNRLRRRVREWIKTRPEILSLPLDTVILIKKDAPRSQRRAFYEELERALQRLE